ncbi:MAG: hypothetical protein KJ630_10200 [Proteobacteria bacterium]|nr:hypothetical protein [Pseudomonadota bacterium]
MKKRKQELIGSFTVINDKQELRKIVVSQDIISHYYGKTNHSKNLNLDSIDGEEVFKTEDPDVFRLSDGATLRRKSSNRPYLE